MEPSWQNLPKEILNMIFHHHSKYYYDMLPLLLTCKNWGQIAKEFFYKRDIYFGSSNTQLILDCLEQPNNTARFLVKSITISGDIIRNGQLIRFISLCPNLNFVTFGPWLKEYHDINTVLYNLSSKGHLQKFKQLYNEYVSIPTKDYSKAMIELKNSLTHLILADDDVSSRFAYELANRLDDFICLESLEIKTHGFIHLHELDSFVKGIGLKTVKITFSNSKTTGSLEPTDFDTIASQPQVKTLTLKIGTFRPLDIEYIMRKFSNLERMDVFGFELCVSTEAWVLSDIPTASTLERFFLYLKQIPTFSVRDVSIPNTMLEEFLSYIQGHFEIQYLGIIHLSRASEETQIWFERLEPNTCRLKLQVWIRDTVPRFKHALNAFNESIKCLDLGKIDYSFNDLPGHLEDQISKQYGDFCGLAINTFPLLKSIDLNGLSITNVTQNGSQILSLDLLFTGSLSSNVLFEISQHVNYIKEFRLMIKDWSNDELATSSGEIEIKMPHTTFDCIILIDSKFSHVKIQTSLRTTYYEIVDFRRPGQIRMDSDFYNGYYKIITKDCYDSGNDNDSTNDYGSLVYKVAISVKTLKNIQFLVL